jgi:anti-sigma regulatory factor (Ser/Thr protein kinase)
VSAPTGCGRRFRHELVLHDGPRELVDAMVPFVRDGAAAGERVVVVGEPDFIDALLSAAPDLAQVHTLSQPGRARYPGRDLTQFREALVTLTAGNGDEAFRVVNQMPVMTAYQWQEWRRYEAAVNVVLADHPVWGACAYDRQLTPSAVLDDLEASHSHLLTSEGSRPSEAFDRLDDRLDGYLDVPPHPIEATDPALVLSEPTAADARRAVAELAGRSGLPDDATEVAVLAASETVTNGFLHGRPPVSLRGWTSPGELTVAVTDAGRGPHPLVGLIPPPVDSTSGRGVWILHQLVSDLHHRRDEGGYTVRFTVDGACGTPV